MWMEVFILGFPTKRSEGGLALESRKPEGKQQAQSRLLKGKSTFKVGEWTGPEVALA